MTAYETEGLVEMLTRIVALVRRRAHALYERTGLTTLQLQAMHILKTDGPMTLSELSRRIHLNLSTVSALVDRMVKRGLVTKERLDEDRRAVHLALAQGARALMSSLPSSPTSVFKEALAPLTAAEKKELFRLVAKIGERLQQRLGDRAERMRAS